MKTSGENNKDGMKSDLEPVKSICRCCLNTDRRMYIITKFKAHLNDLAGINVSESDGLPQWLCWECSSLLQKAVKFKHKVLKAHTMLYEYLIRCAPFPIDAQDAELSKYASPQLIASETLNFETLGKGKTGFQLFQHKKKILKSELDNIEVQAVSAQKVEDELVKEETGFSDYEDNITLEEIRSDATRLTDEVLANFLEDSQTIELKPEDDVKRKKKKKDKVKVKKKKLSEDIEELIVQKETTKSTIRKSVELDPNKIRVVILNPEEQIKQREEESRAGFRYPFQCHLCYKGFNFESKLKNHMNKHSPSRGPYECELCRMYLPTSYSFSVHSLIHNRRYECVECSRRMIDKASILDHYRSQHEGVLTLYTCVICGKVSNNNKTHRGHMRNHHGGDRPKCDQCGKTFVNKDSLAEHEQIHQGIKNYECSICGKRCRTRTQIKHHQLKHTDVKEYYCVECDVRFKSAQSLRQHLQKSMKHKDRQTLNFGCSRCDKRFATERQLAHHSAVQHEGVRAHVCATCGAALASRTSLAKHALTVHQGRRPPPRHVCDTCGKAFRGKSVLLNHVRTHTGEKPFECTECGRKFTQRSAMRTHVKLVHLKLRRSAKIKPEILPEPKLDNMFTKTEPTMMLDPWPRQPSCEVFFHVSAGP